MKFLIPAICSACVTLALFVEDRSRHMLSVPHLTSTNIDEDCIETDQ